MAVAEGVPLLMRLVSSSVAVSYRAAKIAKDVLSKGDLGIVEKVRNSFSFSSPVAVIFTLFTFIKTGLVCQLKQVSILAN